MAEGGVVFLPSRVHYSQPKEVGLLMMLLFPSGNHYSTGPSSDIDRGIGTLPIDRRCVALTN